MLSSKVLWAEKKAPLPERFLILLNFKYFFYNFAFIF
jgi:hypothetical protein